MKDQDDIAIERDERRERLLRNQDYIFYGGMIIISILVMLFRKFVLKPSFPFQKYLEGDS